jgi:hypothetical protein
VRQTQDPVGYRRGLVLGLTLAETLLLVLFLLLLVYAALLQARDRKIAEQEDRIAELDAQFSVGLKELVQALAPGGNWKSDPTELSLRLTRITKDLSRLKSLEAQLKAYERIVSKADDAARIGDAFDKYKIPQSPEQVLEERIQQAEAEEKRANGETIGPSPPNSPTQPERPKTLEDALAAIDRMSGQLNYFQRVASSKEGNGLTLPPCWQRNNQIVYTYDATLLDNGLRLSVSDSRDGMDMAGLRLNGPEPPINTVISRQAFLERTRGMFEWSAQQRCRFYVRILDGTSPDNKSGYKQTRTTVENHFYIRIVE